MASWTNRTVTNNHLIPYVDSKKAPPEVAAALNTLPFERNIFKLLANADSLFTPFMPLLASCWGPGRAARPSEWQLTVLRTSALLDAPYEWDVNEPVARVLGFGDERLALIRKGDLSSTALFTDRHRLIGEMVRELVEGNQVMEATMRRAQEMLGPKVTMEVMMIHSIYGMLARIMRSAKIDFDPEIPGLLDMLRGYNARAIEEEKKYAEEDGIGFFPA
ncbi:AhpD-like protein [Amylostereum chailletii]|nr:AhpD-like protein [Amylostereum chailletii]